MNYTERTILHCDLNNFFASVACRDDPSLKGKAVAVCGSVEERHGIVLAKNEIAKRFGVTTAEAVWQAKQKCPDLVIVKPNYERYEFFSMKAKEIYARYTDLIEPFGIDECWLDVSGSTRLFGDGETIAHIIKNQIKMELGLTISVGVSYNKAFAKVASDMKKPDAVSIIPYDNFRTVLWNMPANVLLGVGKSTELQLKRLAIFTVGDLAICDKQVVEHRLGKNGGMLHDIANGIENSPVKYFEYKHIPKSIGRSTTCQVDLLNQRQAEIVLLGLSEKVAAELRKESLQAEAICVSIRTNDLYREEYMVNLERPTQLATTLSFNASKLLRQKYSWHSPLRSIGVRAIKLSPVSAAFQLSFFDNFSSEKKEEDIEKALDRIHNRFGITSVKRCCLLNDYYFKQSVSTPKLPGFSLN